MSKPANHCDECKHFCAYDDTTDLCAKGHRPKLYKPRNNDPYDPLAGYKRRCSDFTFLPPTPDPDHTLLRKWLDTLTHKFLNWRR